MNEADHREPAEFWTNASVTKLFGNADPVSAVIAAARAVVVSALDQGWEGPPYDPIWLADFLKVPVVPRDDVLDARLVPLDEEIVRIEYNPNRPAGRRRFSVAHELAHTLFPDYREATRNRARLDRATSDDWQLELLCNLAAAEFVMPIGSFSELAGESLELRALLDLRKKFGVSTEALLLRATRLHKEPVAVFAASQRDAGPRDGSYHLDYVVNANEWRSGLQRGAQLANSVVEECTAIGWSAHADAEQWLGSNHSLRVDAVGVPPFPGHLHPRVVGLIRPADAVLASRVGLTFLCGDASVPRGSGPRIIAHIVNNRARHWKGGFAASLRTKWPAAATDFTSWVDSDRANLRLGAVHFTCLDQDVWAAALVAQVGYGPSERPRLRYVALRTALAELADFADKHSAAIQMPRIGAGQAGGRWSVIEDLIESELCARQIPATVYDPPGQPAPAADDLLELAGRSRM